MVEDPELAEALDRAAGEVTHRSRASLVRELAIIGAGQVTGSRPETALEFLLAIPGARGPKSGAGGIHEFLAEHPPVPYSPDDPDGLSRALEEQREERL